MPPASHFVQRAGAPPTLAGSYYNCIACHAPQAGAQPLIRNLSN